MEPFLQLPELLSCLIVYVEVNVLQESQKPGVVVQCWNLCVQRLRGCSWEFETTQGSTMDKQTTGEKIK